MVDTHLDWETLARLVDDGETHMSDEELRHLGACDECTSAYLDAVRSLRAWHSPPPSKHPATRFRATMVPLGGLAVAASLVAALLLPPRATIPWEPTRGVVPAGFVAPVEGEVVRTSRGELRWTEVAGAREYHVQIRSEAGEIVWERTTADTSARWTAPGGLVANRPYRAYLSVQPADLLAPGSVSVEFRAGAQSCVLAHRLRVAARRAARGGALGLGLRAVAGRSERLYGWHAFRRRRPAKISTNGV